MAAILCVLSETYTSDKRNSTLCSRTGVKWFININKGLSIKLPAKGGELPISHPRRIGEKTLLTNYAKEKTLNR